MLTSPIGDRVWVFEHARRRGPSIALLLPAGQAGQLQSTPEADIDRSPWDVSFVPIADIAQRGSAEVEVSIRDKARMNFVCFVGTAPRISIIAYGPPC